MKRIITVVTAAIVVLTLCVVHPLAASTATVGYSLTRVEPMLGTVTVTENYASDTYHAALQSDVSFPIDRWVNYYPPSWDNTYILTLWFDEANYEGATGLKFYIVTCNSGEDISGIRINVTDAVVSINSFYDDYGVFFNEVTIYGENIDFSSLNIVVDCYVGDLNLDAGDRGVSFPVSKLSVTYDAATSQGIFLESLNESTTAIYNSLTNMTPEMESKLDEFDSVVTDTGDKAGQAEDELSDQDPDFKDDNVSISDELKDTADQMGEIVEDSGYTQWLNDVFGHWFFVAVFSVLGGLAFFGRAVFG